MNFKPTIRLLRPIQWVKNGFVGAPLFFSGEMLNPASAIRVVAGVILFCLLASCLYIINDLCDREADRTHPKKRLRPLASGQVSKVQAFLLLAVLIIGGLALLWWLRPNKEFLVTAGIYTVSALAYSWQLKHFALLELFIVASGYVLRVIAGALLVPVQPSPWILTATGLVALLITAGKRRADLAEGFDESKRRRSLEGYSIEYLDSIVTMCSAMTILAYILFTVSPYAINQYHSPYLVLTSVFVAYGVLRYKQLLMVKSGADDPTWLVLKDPGIVLSVVAWVGTFFAIVYAT